MSIKLLAPGRGTGKRKKYKFYYIIGSLGGAKIEETTKTVDYQLARDALENLKEGYRKAKKVKQVLSFAEVSERFKESRPNLSKEDQKRIDRLCALIGYKPVMDVVADDINRLMPIAYPNGSAASTVNRYLITPASMILNYASSNKWREPIKLKRLKEKTPKPRYTTEEDEKILVHFLKNEYGKESDEVLIVTWLYRQGDRITNSLKPTYEDFDFTKEIYSRHVTKSDKYDEVPLDHDICTILKKRFKKGVRGRVFRWKTRWGVSKWLRKHCGELKVTVTPHMARHTLGKRLNDSGAGLKTIMQVLGQTDPRSAIRYQTTGIEELRAAKNKTIVGFKEGKRKNAK